MRVCPEQAIHEQDKQIGTIEIGTWDNFYFVMGQLEVGNAMSPPIIRAVKKHSAENGLTILDCPPGTSCPMITAVHDADFVLLITEPTPFGLHDLQLAVETVRQLKLPLGVAINRADAGDDRVVRYCREEALPVMISIPDDRRIAEAYSNGEVLTTAVPELLTELRTLISDIQQQAGERHR